MLTLTFYKNVPLQPNYANVILFNSANDVLQYLEGYEEDTITNINKFFGNDTYIDVTPYFEGCNYLHIYDNRSNKPHKFFFIENMQFISGGATRYSIILDVWNTYSYDTTFKPSRLITGHADVFGINNVKRYLTNNNHEGDCTLSKNSTMILRSWEVNKNASLILCVSTPTGPAILFTQVTSDRILGDNLSAIKRNKFKYNAQMQDYVTFEIMKCYIVNDFEFKTRLDAYQEQQDKMYGSIYRMGDDLIYTDNQWYYVTSDILSPHQTLKILVKNQPYFNDITTYDGKTQKLLKRYKIGTMTNNQEVSMTSESTLNTNLYVYLFSNYQMAFYLEYEGARMCLNNEFEVPYVNDNYTLYMARNQAQIDANNRSMALGVITSLGFGMARATGGATAGASLMAGAQMSTNLMGFVSQLDKQRARLEDASRMNDRADAIYSAGLITLNEGVGVYEIIYNDNTEILNTLNYFGTIQKTYINTYIANDRSLYNFYFVQFDEVQLYGEYANNIRGIIETIFTNGVRIWCDASKYMSNVNYKK